MKSYKPQTPTSANLRGVPYEIGESIETKMERILQNGEPINDGAPIIFTERKDGVQPQYNIRNDRMEQAVEAMDKITKTALAKRAERIAEREKQKIKPENPGV